MAHEKGTIMIRTRSLLTLLSTCLLALGLAGIAGAQETLFWDDGEPEVVLGVYFDKAGTDTLLEGEVPDSLVAYVIMWNGGLRDEGVIRALEYRIDIPDGLVLVRDVIPDYSTLSMGTVTAGFTQAISGMPGDGLLMDTLYLARIGEIAFDAEFRVLPNPASGYLRYVHQVGSGVSSVAMRLMQPQDAIINPKLSTKKWEPVRARSDR
jgi:hypothetical protein